MTNHTIAPLECIMFELWNARFILTFSQLIEVMIYSKSWQCKCTEMVISSRDASQKWSKQLSHLSIDHFNTMASHGSVARIYLLWQDWSSFDCHSASSSDPEPLMLLMMVNQHRFLCTFFMCFSSSSTSSISIVCWLLVDGNMTILSSALSSPLLLWDSLSV